MDKYILTIVAVKDIIDELATYDDERCKFIEGPKPPQEPRWIPVKDRLPQKGEYGDVLVTFVPPAGTLWTTVMIARYSDLMGIAKPCFHIGEVGKENFENITPQVTAWMPLPKNYKGD